MLPGVSDDPALEGIRPERVGGAMSVEIRVGDCLDVLRTLDAESVQCCVTSPPYFGLRDYGHAGQIGLEPTPDEYVGKLVAVFREVRRVLANDGTLWLNLGDSYTGSGKGGNPDPASSKQATNRGSQTVGCLYETGRTAREAAVTNVTRRNFDIGPKQLLMMPARVALALQADGWYLRSDIIWHKPNPMPESVTDRPTKAHEYLFLLARSERYYYDADAIREPLTSDRAPSRKANANGVGGRARSGNKERKYGDERDRPDSHLAGSVPWEDDGTGRNKRDVWSVEGTSNRERECLAILDSDLSTPDKWDAIKEMMSGAQSDVWRISVQPYSGAHFATFPPALIEPCILAGSRLGDTILDPFGGAGTTGLVASRLQRNALLIELNPDYAALARRRIHDDAPLFSGEVA